jgi:hypothetical protein
VGSNGVGQPGAQLLAKFLVGSGVAKVHEGSPGAAAGGLPRHRRGPGRSSTIGVPSGAQPAPRAPQSGIPALTGTPARSDRAPAAPCPALPKAAAAPPP